MPRTKTRAAVSQPLVSLNLTAEQFEIVRDAFASGLRSEVPIALSNLDGAELLAAAEKYLSAKSLRAKGREYLAAAKRPKNAEQAASFRRTGSEYLESAEDYAEGYAETIGVYRALLAQAPQLVA